MNTNTLIAIGVVGLTVAILIIFCAPRLKSLTFKILGIGSADARMTEADSKTATAVVDGSILKKNSNVTADGEGTAAKVKKSTLEEGATVSAKNNSKP